MCVLTVNSACRNENHSSPKAQASFDASLAKEVIVAYADLVYANYQESMATAFALDLKVREFVAAPSAQRLTECRTAWTTAREPYQQSEAFRFYGGPIDRAPDGPEGDLNPWPLDEAYIGYILDGRASGIGDGAGKNPQLNEALLRALNGKGGEQNIATGWHAVEFMLWGEDVDAQGPGARSHEDFIGAEGQKPARRRRYLSLVASMILKDLEQVTKEWHPKTGAYREEFLAYPPKKALSKIMTGMGTLAIGELRGERMVAPFLSKSQEDEHSCFSDQTHLDAKNDALGIRNVWRGEYGSKLKGPSVRELVAKVDEDLALGIDADIDAVLQAVTQPAFSPFDQAILGADQSPGRKAIQGALDALARLDRSLTSMAKRLDIPVVTRLPR